MEPRRPAGATRTGAAGHRARAAGRTPSHRERERAVDLAKPTCAAPERTQTLSRREGHTVLNNVNT